MTGTTWEKLIFAVAAAFEGWILLICLPMAILTGLWTGLATANSQAAWDAAVADTGKGCGYWFWWLWCWAAVHAAIALVSWLSGGAKARR